MVKLVTEDYFTVHTTGPPSPYNFLECGHPSHTETEICHIVVFDIGIMDIWYR